MIRYRKATFDDADSLARIHSVFLLEANDIDSEEKRVFMEEENKKYFSAALAADEFVAWLALDENEIVATSGLSFSAVPPSFRCPDGRAAYIMNMYTVPSHRRRGIAFELFKRIVGEAKHRRYTKITLHATDMGKPLYEKYGFKDVSGEMVYYTK